MNRRAKVELFEQIGRDYEFGSGTISGVARSYGVHRRMVRQALRMRCRRSESNRNGKGRCLSPVMSFVDEF